MRADQPAAARCHHCGVSLGRRAIAVALGGRTVRVCGDACRGAVLAIDAAGLGAWYELRAHADAEGALDSEPRFQAELDSWRVPEVAAAHLRRARSGESEVTLTVEGMRCAGCAWLVEGLLGAIPGVSRAGADFPLRRAEVRFDPGTTSLDALLQALARAGYRAAPYTAQAEETAIESERRARIRGLGISAVFGMQVMLLSIALHLSGASEDPGGMGAGFERLFRWLAMLLTVPVLVWPGRTFFTGAVAALRGRRLTMDVPVALGLSIAFLGSVLATLTGEGDIWFDSVVMFVTLLGGARYLELVARRRSGATIRALARSAPLVATRVGRSADTVETEGEGDRSGEERVPAATLRRGDFVRIRPGEVVPGDGRIRSGSSAFDESLLTGEADPVTRSTGGRVLAGSVNGPGVVEIEVESAGETTVLAGVLAHAERAARERPAIAILADRAAAWFIAGVLALAAGVAVAWLLHEPSRAVAVVVSVLVVTCPCALSLATPATMTAALGALARAGLVATRADAVERLALATHCLADKTGTLTEGRFRLRTTARLGSEAKGRCLAIAAALERHAAHPIAAAFAPAAKAEGATPDNDSITQARAEGNGSGSGRAATGSSPHLADPDAIAVEDPRADTGGVTGRIDGIRHAVGSPEFVTEALGLSPLRAHEGGAGSPGDADGDGTRDEPTAASVGCAPAAGGPKPAGGGANRVAVAEAAGTRVLLAREGEILARFTLSDSPHPGAKALVEGLRARGIETTVASGDSAAPVDRVAAAVGIARRLAGLSPADKLAEARRLGACGERVLMLGDGVNDAPALAGAHVSVAMGHGAAAAATRADAVLLGDDPRALLRGVDIARRARRIVKQNLGWALAYNLVALPLAATGAIPPWAAAIGMSLSSLVVAGNALRVLPRRAPGGRNRPMGYSCRDGNPAPSHRDLDRGRRRDRGTLSLGGPLRAVRRSRHPGGADPRR